MSEKLNLDATKELNNISQGKESLNDEMNTSEIVSELKSFENEENDKVGDVLFKKIMNLPENHPFFDNEEAMKLIHEIGYNRKPLNKMSERLKNDKNFILNAIKNWKNMGPEDVSILSRASDTIRGDKDFMLELIKINPYSFEKTSSVLNSNPDFIKEAVEMDSTGIVKNLIEKNEMFSDLYKIKKFEDAKKIEKLKNEIETKME